eukprot:gene15606-biopygen17191
MGRYCTRLHTVPGCTLCQAAHCTRLHTVPGCTLYQAAQYQAAHCTPARSAARAGGRRQRRRRQATTPPRKPTTAPTEGEEPRTLPHPRTGAPTYSPTGGQIRPLRLPLCIHRQLGRHVHMAQLYYDGGDDGGDDDDSGHHHHQHRHDGDHDHDDHENYDDDHHLNMLRASPSLSRWLARRPVPWGRAPRSRCCTAAAAPARRAIQR